MPAFLIPGIMAALGAGKGVLDNVAAGKQRKAQAATTQWSPWTGMKAEAPKDGDILGGAMSGFMGGMMLQNANPKMFGGGDPSINLWENMATPADGVPSSANFNPQFGQFGPKNRFSLY